MSSHFFMKISTAIAVACLSVLSASHAADVKAAAKKSTVIPAQGLAPALQLFSKERDIHVVFISEDVSQLRTNGASGELTVDEALSQLLQGTGLTYRYIDHETISILPVAGAAYKSTAGQSPVGEGRIAQADESSSSGMKRVASQGTGDASSKEDSNTSNDLQEIVVTAQKREEKVLDVPISIAVITNQEIERRTLIGMEDYLRSIPGVNQMDRGGTDNTIIIRGITTSPQEENFSSGTTVASYFDESPITAAGGITGAGIDVRPVDIERIEVLRGPQGTAYGSASLGGTLRIIPVKPKLDGFSGKLAAAYSDTGGFGSGNTMLQGVVNIPIAEDKFAIRAVGYRYDESGFYRNIAGADPATVAFYESLGLGDFLQSGDQDDMGRMLSTGGRLAALWQATERLDVSMNLLTQDIEQDGRPDADAGQFEQARGPIAPQGRRRGEEGELQDTNIDLLNLVINYDLGWSALTSAVSWIDSGSQWAFTFNPIAFPALAPSSTTALSGFKSFTAEMRLASKLDGRFQFLGGLFYEDVQGDVLQTFDWPSEFAPNPTGIDPLLLLEGTRDLDQSAIFGEITYDLTDELSATVGGRYYKYEKQNGSIAEGGFFGIPPNTTEPVFQQGSDNGSTYKANLSYKFNQDSLIYASWAEGFRLGPPDSAGPDSGGFCDTDNDGILDGTNVSLASIKHVESDYLDNYEIGGKFSLFNRRMLLDVSIYHIDWTGLPVRQIAPGCGFAYTDNAGAATSDGMELQASVFVVEGLRIDFGGGYTKAELSEDVPPQGWEEGDRLPGSPKFSANLAAQYDFEVAGHKAFVRADSFYTGEFYGDLQETLRAGDYIKVDARAGVAIRNLSVELFVRNLTNEDSLTWTDVFNRGFRMRPRTVGIQLGYSFE